MSGNSRDSQGAAGPVRKLSGSWTRPAQPKRVNRPSWIGTPRAAFEAVAAQIDAEDRAAKAASAPPPPSFIPSRPPPSTNNGPQRTASGSAFVAMGRSVAPAPMISSAREVELEGEVLALRAEVAKLAAHLSALKSAVIEESEPEIVRLALAIATRVVGREVNADPTMIHEWIAEGARLMPNRGEITVVVSPDIAALMGGDVDDIGGRAVIVEASLPPGTCELREGSASVNVGADARLAAMADALGADHHQ